MENQVANHESEGVDAALAEQKLSDLEGFAAKLRGDLAGLDRHLAGQGAAQGAPVNLEIAPESAPELARRAKLAATVAELEREVEDARLALKETYEELESVEQARHSRAVTKPQSQSRRDAVATRERDVSLYRRRSAAGD